MHLLVMIGGGGLYLPYVPIGHDLGGGVISHMYLLVMSWGGLYLPYVPIGHELGGVFISHMYLLVMI